MTRHTFGTAALIMAAAMLTGCGGTAEPPHDSGLGSQPTGTATVTIIPASDPAEMAVPSPALPRPSLTPSPLPSPRPPHEAPPSTPAPTITPNPFSGLSIDELSSRTYGGGQLEIIDTIETNDLFTRYLITYPSDGLTIYGFMNVPNEGDHFPLALVLHGYVNPVNYETVPYTRRYADALAEAGYFVIHPNFRNHPPSDHGPDPFRIGYAIDVLNLIAVVREQSRDPLGTLRRVDADQIHVWGHSMGGGVALRVLAVNNAPYLRAAVLYGSMSGNEARNYERIGEWTNNRGGRFERSADQDTLAAISAESYLNRIETALSVHHSFADDVVPVEWSEILCRQLEALHAAGEIPAAPDCSFYAGQPHTFRGSGDALFIERTIEFFASH